MKAAYFFLGVVATVVVGVIITALVVHFGWFPTNADGKPGRLEVVLANQDRDAFTDKAAPQQENPFKVTDENLAAGMKIYRDNCAGCHGDGTGASHFGQSFWPAAPQFVDHGPRDEDRISYYTIKHGIRLTGMPAFDSMLKDDDIWKAAMFIRNIKTLPPALQQQYKTKQSS